MFSEQVLEYPASAALPAAQVEEYTADDDAGSLLQSHAPPVRPRASLDTLLAHVAALFALLVTHPQLVPASLAGVMAVRLSVLDLLLAGAFFFVWPKVLTLTGVYERRYPQLRGEIFSVVLACSIGTMIAFCLISLSTADLLASETLVIFWVMLITVLLSFRGFARAVNTHLRTSRRRRVLIVGSGMRANRLAAQLESRPRDYELIGYVDNAADGSSTALLGSLDDLENILAREVVDEVLIALPIKSCYAAIESAIEVAERVGVESKYLADVFRCQLAKVRYEHRIAIPFMSMKVVYDDYRVRVKRAFDFCAALGGIIVLSPVILAIALLVKVTSPGPIIFAQERYGLNKRRFKMFKFRTMVPDAERLQAELEDINEAAGPVFKIKNDPRVTPIGRFLRKTSLDELPQLFNVLRGEMSLVGPRPLPVRDVQLFDEPWFMRRFSVRPGLTCLWQISGRSNLGFDDWVVLDLKYIDEWSLGMDLRILAKTIPAVVRGVGAA